jgi:ABC-type transport system involved in multi-copper enzyme maturation permease subunit
MAGAEVKIPMQQDALAPVQATAPEAPSPWRAWGYLVWLSVQRQARGHMMLGVSLALLALSAFLVQLLTSYDRFSMQHWRYPRRVGLSYVQHVHNVELAGQLPWGVPQRAVHFAAAASVSTIVRETSRVPNFANQIVFALFTTLLLPLWSLTFAVEALGRERESQQLLWLLVRPVPRPALYLGKYLAALPWCLGFNLGGFGLLCWLGGEPGRLAFRLFWPGVVWGTFAFAALFHLMGACLRRAGVLALLYAFFLETVAGNLPGQFKRLSISFYTRCVMFEQSEPYGIGPDRPWLFQPVSGATATLALAGITIALLIAGMVLFTRNENLDSAT